MRAMSFLAITWWVIRLRNADKSRPELQARHRTRDQLRGTCAGVPLRNLCEPRVVNLSGVMP